LVVGVRRGEGPSARNRSLSDPWAGTDLDIYRSNFASLRREIRQLLVGEGLLLTDLRALHVIREQPTRPTALAVRLDLTPAAGTQLIDRLERHELVRRSRDPRDRRATVVRLTLAGSRAYERASRAVRALIQDVVRGMTPAGLDALRRGSDELARVLESRTAA
jgi:DNA-binding MarR family transcriptional regulator